MDAIGAEWGPICTSSLLITRSDLRKAIGYVNLAEFFVTTTMTRTLGQSLSLINSRVHHRSNRCVHMQKTTPQNARYTPVHNENIDFKESVTATFPSFLT